MKIRLLLIAFLLNVSGTVFSQKNSISVMGTTYPIMSSASIIYERSINISSNIDIIANVFIGNVRSHLLQFSHTGHELNGGIGGVGFSIINQYRKSSKWEAGVKIFRLNSGAVERTFWPSANLGLRWNVSNILIRTGLETTAGLYLSIGYTF